MKKVHLILGINTAIIIPFNAQGREIGRAWCGMILRPVHKRTLNRAETTCTRCNHNYEAWKVRNAVRTAMSVAKNKPVSHKAKA